MIVFKWVLSIYYWKNFECVLRIGNGEYFGDIKDLFVGWREYYFLKGVLVKLLIVDLSREWYGSIRSKYWLYRLKWEGV